MSVSGMEAQFTAMIGASRRLLWSCTARATSSLPVPDSPRMSTVASVAATLRTRSKTSRIGGQLPTMPCTA